MICYKVLKFIDNDFYSSIYIQTPVSRNNFFAQKYFVDKINYPKYKNTELFVFQDLRRAKAFAELEVSSRVKVVVWKCYCPSLRKITPGYLQDSKSSLNEYWKAVKEIRMKKRAANDIELKKYDLQPCYITNAYSTPYISFLETVWQS